MEHYDISQNVRQDYTKPLYNSLRIQNGDGVITIRMQNTHQVYKHCLTHTKLKLVHEIQNEHLIEVVSKIWNEHLIEVESVFKESK